MGNSDESVPCALYSSETNENWIFSLTVLFTYFIHIYPILFVRVTDRKEKSKISVLPESGNEMLCQMAPERVLWYRHISFKFNKDHRCASEKPLNRW